MAGGITKATKKFQKNHLKDTLDKRKEVAKIKQRQQVKAKKKARHAEDYPKPDVAAGSKANGRPKADEADKDLSKMSVDEFFQGGFEVPDQMLKTSKGKNKAGKSVTGKRKRGSDDEVSGSASDGSDKEQFLASGEDDLGAHKEDLEALAEKDPEFYKYLKENDAELLDFKDIDLAELDELSEEDAPEDKKSKKDHTEEPSTLSMATVRRWKTAMAKQYSLRAMRQAVLAFRAAAFLNSDEEKQQRYTISSPNVYHEVLVTTLQSVPIVLNHHLPAKETAGKVRIATDSKKFRSLTPFLKSYTSSVLHVLATLSDAPTIKLTLSSLTPLLPYLLSFKKLLKVLIKTVITIYSTSSLTDTATLITAFLLLRRLFMISDASIREATLKQTYQGLVTSARTTNTHTIPTINLMKNSSVELWSLDPGLSYTVGFVSLRQLAVHLRTSITHPTKDSYKQIYNWQFTHSLDFFSRILSTCCSPATNPMLKTPSDSPLHPLIYPLVQITLGSLRLIPTPTYYPLRFHLTRSLLRISRTTQTYIPLAPALLEVLQSPEMTKPPHASTLTPLDFSVVLRAPKSYLRSRTYQDGLGAQVQELLADFFACWAKNIAFPELALPPTVMLKRWHKSVSHPSRPANASQKKGGGGNKNTKISGLIFLLLEKIAMNSAFIEEHRRNVTFGPGNREEVDAFLVDVNVEDTPMGAFSKGLRMRREEREQVVERGRKEEEKRRVKDKNDEEQSLRKGLKMEMNRGEGSEEDEETEAVEEEDDLEIEIDGEVESEDD